MIEIDAMTIELYSEFQNYSLRFFNIKWIANGICLIRYDNVMNVIIEKMTCSKYEVQHLEKKLIQIDSLGVIKSHHH